MSASGAIRATTIAAMLAIAGTSLAGATEAHGGAARSAAVQGAAVPDAAGRLAFDIPEQPLETALDAFSRASGIQVLYESALARDVSALGVRGHFTPEVALNTLIAGSDLVARFVGPQAVTLVGPGEVDNASPPMEAPLRQTLTLRPMLVTAEPDAERFRAYAAVLRGDIERALKRDTRTRSGPYVAGLRLWVDPSRTVRRTELVQSSGNSDRDAAIFSALSGLTVSEPPPPRLPTPVVVKIRVSGL